ncbi:hypothetical protein GN299_08965 [Pseudomonas putida]|uniref:RHS repeat-associated core domain-containing protein n=1 Tax=Pseudomonas putida TaxID=303 RepID=A0A7V8EI23_PSEPU|nr:hypothetical protein GN299_08965 [Pseudomonas putida]
MRPRLTGGRIMSGGYQLMDGTFSKPRACVTTLLTVDQQRTVSNHVDQYQLLRSIAYTPYGHRSSDQGCLGFNGEWLDSSALHYFLGNGYRAFCPAFTRFRSPDSMSPFGSGGLNAYGYCGQDPINYRDPTGHSRVGMIYSSLRKLFGWRKGHARSQSIGRNVVETIHSSVAPVALAPVKLFDRRNGLGKVNAPGRGWDDTYVTMNVTTGQEGVKGRRYLGLHGSDLDYKSSLEAGLDIKHSAPRRADGPGFYYSKDLTIALRFAKAHGGQGHVYGVYGSQGLVEGVDTFDSNSFLGHIGVIRESGFKHVIVRDYIQY